MPAQRHTNPTLLNTPEKIIWGMTGRQLIILGLGVSLGYRLWSDQAYLLAFGASGFILRLALALLPVILALAFAFFRPNRQHLEVWCYLLVRYRMKRKQLVWTSVAVQDRYRPAPEQALFAGAQEQDEEEGE